MAKKEVEKDDVFSEENEVQSQWVKFNVPLEDRIFGTLIAKRQVKSTMPGKETQVNNVYDMKAEYGSFHRLDENEKIIDEPIVIEKEEIWSVGGTSTIDRQMRNIRVGQKIGLKFIETQPSKTKGFKPAKIVKVYAPKDENGQPQMDGEFLAQLDIENFNGAN